MASRHKVLSLLEEHKGSFISGEEIARKLSITRAAVWRAIGDLRTLGYDIESSTRIGYRLSERSDKLSAEGIRSVLPTSYLANIIYYDTIDSTNREAKQLALEGAPQGTIVVASQQTAGRGRLGRSFFSPKESGLYMSIVLRPEMNSSLALRITSAAAVAVCRAIERHCDKEAGIKWVNDVFIDGMKVCGILTEGISGFESGRIESVVVGIGLNHTIPKAGFPSELSSIAGALFSDIPPLRSSRNQVAADIIACFFDLLPFLESSAFLDEYRKRSIVLGKRVLVTHGSESYEAVASGIEEDGSLVVQLPTGELRILSSGEISLKKLA